MNRLRVQFLEQGLHQALFEALPMPIFVVDQEITIFEQNAAASKLSSANEKDWLGRRGGKAIHCLNAALEGHECGESEACADCVVRSCVKAAAKGEHISRQWARMEVLREGKREKLNLRVNCHPLEFAGRPMVILILDGLDG